MIPERSGRRVESAAVAAGSAGSGFGAMLAKGGADALDLLDMTFDVFGVDTQKRLERKRAALGVISGPGEGVLGEVFQEIVVCRSKNAEDFEGLRDFSLLIIELRSPCLLIPGGHGRIFFRDDSAETHHADGFGVGKMADDLANAPLTFGFEIEFGTCGVPHRGGSVPGDLRFRSSN